jgi:hypothetical protein
MERIRMSEISEAYDRLLKSNVRFRFVIDMASMREPPDNRPEAETYRVHLMMAKAFLEHAIDDPGSRLGGSTNPHLQSEFKAAGRFSFPEDSRRLQNGHAV